MNYFGSCQTYEGGFSAVPGTEAHGGYTFCGFACLSILTKESLCDVKGILVSLCDVKGILSKYYHNLEYFEQASLGIILVV